MAARSSAPRVVPSAALSAPSPGPTSPPLPSASQPLTTTRPTPSSSSTASTPATAPRPPPGQSQGVAKRLRQRPPQLSGRWAPLIPNSDGRGRGCGHYVFGQPVMTNKVAAFDLDGTIIRSRGGRSFPRDERDWEWCGDEVVRKLRETHKAGYTLLLLTSQASPLPALAHHFRLKLPHVCRALGVPLHCFAAFEFDGHRKPARGMWDAFLRLREDRGRGIDFEKSFYVGDAAGRPSDHADTDRKFALNVRLPFLTPEDFFTGRAGEEDGRWCLWGWDARGWDHGAPDPPPVLPPTPRSGLESPTLGDYAGPEVVLLVGAPGVGKTRWAEEMCAGGEGWERVAYDAPKPPPAVLDRLRASLATYYAALAPPPLTTTASATATDTSLPSVTPLSRTSAALDPSAPVFLPSSSSASVSSPPSPPKFLIDAPLPTLTSRRALLSFRRPFTRPSPGVPPLKITAVQFTAPPALGRHNAVWRSIYGSAEERRRGLGGEMGNNGGRAGRWEREREEVGVEEGFDLILPVHFRFRPSPSSPLSPAAQLETWQQWLADVLPGKAKKSGVVAVRGPGRTGAE